MIGALNHDNFVIVMQSSVSSSKEIVRLSNSAREKVLSLMAKEHPGEPRALRVSVVGGGCSGMSYKMAFELSPGERDHVFESNQLTLFVDPKSALFLEGLEIDFEDGLNGSGFVYKNPKAAKACGCGTSFAV